MTFSSIANVQGYLPVNLLQAAPVALRLAIGKYVSQRKTSYPIPKASGSPRAPLLPPGLIRYGRWGSHGVPAWLRPCWLQVFLLTLMLPWVAAAAVGVERFPPPEFEPGYVMPSTATPEPRAWPWEYVDVAVLLGCLSLASYYVLHERRRRPVFLLMLFSLFYFGFYRKGCICPVGSIQDVTLALFDPHYLVPLSVLAFFLLPLLFTLFYGRTFCAAVCPLGAIQDVMLVRPRKLAAGLEHALGIIPFVYLGLAVLLAATGSAFLICRYDPFVAFFRRSGTLPMLLLGTAFLAVATVIGRPYCRFLCPYGALLRVISKFAWLNVTLSPLDCIRCQICDVACPFGAIEEPLPVTEKRRLPGTGWRGLLLVGMLPLLLLGGAWLGRSLAVPLSKTHPVVSLAERVAAEDAGQITEPNDASKAFRQTGRATDELVADALQVRKKFELGAALFGAFVGLVVGIKLLGLNYPRFPSTFEPNSSSCLSCGRCYAYCPKEIVRQKRFNRAQVIPLTAKPEIKS
jgi:NosR/NirI family transcriptional regulator, nitrous oxide reductase regulator